MKIQSTVIPSLVILVSLASQGSFASAATVELLTPSERCARIVEVYNRCEKTSKFDAEKNEVILSNGKSLVCNDGKKLSFLDRLKHPDISSMLSQIYTPGPVQLPVLTKDFSPGGIRQQEFAEAIYGGTSEEVEKNLTEVSFLGQEVKFNRKNGAAHQLSLVSNELMALYRSGKDPQFSKFLEPFIGASCGTDRCNLKKFTYDWRLVKGTTTLSNHSFGTAIDMEPASGPEYWLWDLMKQIHDGKAQWAPGTDISKPDYHNVVNYLPKANPTYPEALVEIFEKHGFIWGGKWYRYDVMHFEFRPEFFPNLKLDCGTL